MSSVFLHFKEEKLQNMLGFCLSLFRIQYYTESSGKASRPALSSSLIGRRHQTLPSCLIVRLCGETSQHCDTCKLLTAACV